jgi:hypothetical protein
MSAVFTEYKQYPDIQEGMRIAQVRGRELANHLGIHPRTLSAKLNGYARLTDEERGKIQTFLQDARGRLAARLANG